MTNLRERKILGVKNNATIITNFIWRHHYSSRNKCCKKNSPDACNMLKLADLEDHLVRFEEQAKVIR